jgi:hypothetical protein
VEAGNLAGLASCSCSVFRVFVFVFKATKEAQVLIEVTLLARFINPPPSPGFTTRNRLPVNKKQTQALAHGGYYKTKNERIILNIILKKPNSRQVAQHLAALKTFLLLAPPFAPESAAATGLLLACAVHSI